MNRTLAPLVFALGLCATLAAQPVTIRAGGVPRPAGVISPPLLGIPGSLTPPSPTTPPRPLPFAGRFRNNNQFVGGWGYSPYWPVWYDTDPAPQLTPEAPAPVYTPPPQTTTIVLPTPPAEIKARLSLTVPLRARVWMGDKEVDANAAPVILESPVLREDQSYTFHVKVTWPDGTKTEERTRSVTVGAGDEKSLTYQK